MIMVQWDRESRKKLLKQQQELNKVSQERRREWNQTKYNNALILLEAWQAGVREENGINLQQFYHLSYFSFTIE